MPRWLWPGFVLASTATYVLAFSRGAAREAVLLVPAVQVLLLGTFLDPEGAAWPPTGLADDPNPPGFWAQLVAPLGWR